MSDFFLFTNAVVTSAWQESQRHVTIISMNTLNDNAGKKNQNSVKRYDLIDTLRGLTVISMILYHACWIGNHFGMIVSTQTLYGTAFTIWERSICMSFILISGFCFSFGRRHLRNGLKLFLLGLLITASTVLFVPDVRIIFGILTFLGSAMIFTIPFDKAYEAEGERSTVLKVSKFVVSFFLFIFTYNINRGYVGLPDLFSIDMPQSIYRGYIATYFGFMQPGFFSADYFSILPWFFLYICGYMLNKLVISDNLSQRVMTKSIPGIRSVGRHSLLIYLIHPIVLFLIFYIASSMAI